MTPAMPDVDLRKLRCFAAVAAEASFGSVYDGYLQLGHLFSELTDDRS